MKQSLIFLSIIYLFLNFGCKKDTGYVTPPVVPPKQPTNPVPTGNTTNNNGYIVKSIGVSRIVLGVDKNDKLTTAELYGGGNKIVLKPGTGNVIEMPGDGSYDVLPDALGPSGFAKYIYSGIDNTTMPPDTTGAVAMCVKIKGFDKSKTGYNQLNIVMYQRIIPKPPGTTGYYTDIDFITYDTQKKNADYSGAFFKSLFTGNINVADVEIADYSKGRPYIIDDEVVDRGQGVYSYSSNSCTGMKLYNNTFSLSFSNSPSTFSFGNNLNFEWVNANNGTVTKSDDYDYNLYFKNILTLNTFNLPSDTTSKVFLRITGFDPTVTGFNQLRLFIASGYGTTNDLLPIITLEIPPMMPTLEIAKAAFLGNNVYCDEANPYVSHF